MALGRFAVWRRLCATCLLLQHLAGVDEAEGDHEEGDADLETGPLSLRKGPPTTTISVEFIATMTFLRTERLLSRQPSGMKSSGLQSFK